jgi:hypothetical protein
MMHRKWFAVAAAAANVQSFWISPFINFIYYASFLYKTEGEGLKRQTVLNIASVWLEGQYSFRVALSKCVKMV